MGKALLIIVLGFSGIFTMVLFNATANQQRSSEALVTQYENWVARNTVESLTNVALAKLYNDPTWNAGLSGTFNDATYNVTVSDATIDSVHYAKKDSVTAIATFEGASDTTICETIQPAYSYFQYFADTWPSSSDLQYSTGDTIQYPLHTNQKIEVSGSPVFLGRVSTKDANGYNPTSDSPVFQGGAEFGVATIPMPDTNPILALSGVQEFTNEVWLRFYADGTYDYSTGGPTGPWSSPIALSSTNGVIRTVGGGHHVHVQGTVSGQVTVYSDDDLHIENSIACASDADFLGLISKEHMEVHFPLATPTVLVQAALIVGNDFKVTSHHIVAINLTLRLRGALIVKDDKAFTSQVSGLVLNLDRDFAYDPRMGGRTPRTPPYFPRVPSHIELVYRSN